MQHNLEPCGLSIRQVGERLTLQDSHDLWQARQRLDLSALSPMELKVVSSPWSFRTPCLRA